MKSATSVSVFGPLSVSGAVLGTLVGAILVTSVITACADSASDIPEGGEGAGNGNTTQEPSASLPAPTGGGTSSGSTSSTSSTSGAPASSSSTSSTSSTSSSSSSGSTSGGSGVPACSFAGDFQKMIEKASEIQAQAPCDSTCNVTTHCCLDILGGAGGSGGLPGGSSGLPGGSSGLPGMDAGGIPGTSTSGSGGIPGGGGGGVCVSN